MSLFGNQRIDTMKDTVSNTSIDEGLPRELSQLSLTVSATSQDETYSYKGHPEFTLRHMYGYFQSKQLCDVVLFCGSVRIQAHKLVLVACSEYFAAMFTGNLKESHQEEVTLERIDPNALQSLVQYCYTGAIELREESVESLLSTSCLLQLHAVTSACCAFLRRQLDPCNCLGIALFAEQQACNALHKQATDYTCQHYMQVCKNQEFLQLEPSQLSILLRSEELNVPSEEAVFESLMTWVAHEPTRERHLAELMALVKLPLLTPEYILGHVEHACSSVQECRPLIMEAVSWHLLPERRNKVCSARTRPRTSTIGRLLAVGGMDSYKGGSNMELYDPRTNTWAQFVRLGARRLQFGVAVVQDKLVVVGGRDGLKTLNTVECFDLSCLTWSAMPPMATHRHGLGVAVLGAGPGAPLYAVGGHDGWSYLNTVERWDPVARAWSTVAPMSFARSTCGVGVLDGRVYAVGGRDGGACLRTAECYRPDTNRWTQCAPMNRRRGGVSVSVAGGYLYALGGHDAPAGNPGGGRLSCVERYDPATDCWTIVASLCCARDSIGSTVLGDRVVAVGGYDGSQYLCIVEMYDAHNNEWRTLASLNSGRAGACVVPVPTHTTLQPATSAPGTD